MATKQWLVLGIVLAASTHAQGYAPQSSASVAQIKYANCATMNKDYPGGVSVSKATKNKGGKTKYKPFVNEKLYKLNEARDRDKDGIACEK